MTRADPAITLLPTSDDDFRWMLDQIATSGRALALPPGGVDSPDVLMMLRAAADSVRSAIAGGSWLIATHTEVVGLISFKDPPKNGAVEIGYGVAPSRRRLGYASAAVRALVDLMRSTTPLRDMWAQTSSTNIASHRVLVKAGFVSQPAPDDVAGEHLIRWTLSLERPR